MRVTINTDASVKEGWAGFAFWIVCDAGKIQKAGKIKRKVNGSTDAEIMCIVNSVYTLLHSRFAGIQAVVINTDSQQAINMLAGESSSNSKDVRNAVDECHFLMMELCLKSGRSIRDRNNFFSIRHVKAHNGKSDSRSFVNDWCDKESKKYARENFNTNSKRPGNA